MHRSSSRHRMYQVVPGKWSSPPTDQMTGTHLNWERIWRFIYYDLALNIKWRIIILNVILIYGSHQQSVDYKKGIPHAKRCTRVRTRYSACALQAPQAIHHNKSLKHDKSVDSYDRVVNDDARRTCCWFAVFMKNGLLSNDQSNLSQES